MVYCHTGGAIMFHDCSDYTTSLHHHHFYSITKRVLATLPNVNFTLLLISYRHCLPRRETDFSLPFASMHVLHLTIQPSNSASGFSSIPTLRIISTLHLCSHNQIDVRKLNPTFLINTYMLRKTPTPNSIADEKVSCICISLIYI